MQNGIVDQSIGGSWITGEPTRRPVATVALASEVLSPASALSQWELVPLPTPSHDSQRSTATARIVMMVRTALVLVVRCGMTIPYYEGPLYIMQSCKDASGLGGRGTSTYTVVA